MHKTSESKRKQRGSALVESALILTVGITLMFGTFDLAQMLFVHQVVVNQLRVAGRWAAVHPFDASQITNEVLYGTPTAGTAGSEIAGMRASNVTVTHDTSDGLYADRVTIKASGYTYLMFSGSVANSVRGSGSSPLRTGLTATMTIPHEHVF
jgi:Flp pilus assembly protein TadG